MIDEVKLKDQNGLFRSISEDTWRKLLPHIEEFDMPLGLVLSDSGCSQSYLYFPTNAIVSLLYNLENGSSAEIAVVGYEGCFGVSIFLGGQSTLTTAVVQSAGKSYRIKASVIMEEFNNSSPLRNLLLRYTQAVITQTTQTAVCNRHHTIDQQFCRWLLLSLDRLDGNELVMTQELIANMLGVRREGVTEAAHKIQAEGIIKYTRGHISVLNRPMLEKRACECYHVVKDEYDRLLPHTLAI
ncbi:Crp cAMP-binding proteins - catabolite gene activator and regulatory subunit of cAMP-dependent protein kinases [Methylophilaceae bacterium]